MNVNGYSIRFNILWGTWQVSHKEIAPIVAEFKTMAEAVNYCQKR